MLLSCNPEGEQVREFEEYTGPIREMDSIELLHSDSAVIKARIIAAKVMEFENGDREFPEGVFLEFYDRTGQITSTLKANSAHYIHEEGRWKGMGDVVLRNELNFEQLNTEELYWEPETGDVYTDKYVKIESGTELITGTGLRSKQDFSEYTILKPEGVFNIEE